LAAGFGPFPHGGEAGHGEPRAATAGIRSSQSSAISRPKSGWPRGSASRVWQTPGTAARTWTPAAGRCARSHGVVVLVEILVLLRTRRLRSAEPKVEYKTEATPPHAGLAAWLHRKRNRPKNFVVATALCAVPALLGIAGIHPSHAAERRGHSKWH
jgi:hypothetical protein